VRFVTLTAAIALVAAVSFPLATRQLALAREAAAREWLRAIGDAQEQFRTAHGGYAAKLDSLVEACAGKAAFLSATLTHGGPGLPAASASGTIVDHGHEIAMRPARDAADGPVDCHGRATTTDFYLSVRPVHVDRYAMRALAMTSTGRVYEFHDGVPPTEPDMSPDGLALPIDEWSR
jgi:hypothetical protein